MLWVRRGRRFFSAKPAWQMVSCFWPFQMTQKKQHAFSETLKHRALPKSYRIHRLACWGYAENHLGDGVQLFSGELRCADSTQADITVLKGPLTPGVGVVRVDCNTIYDFVIGGLEEDVIELSQAREPQRECSSDDEARDLQSDADEKGAFGG